MYLQFRQLLIVAALFWVAQPSLAQELPRVRNFPPTEYGSQSQNWSLAQNAEGGLWVGNNGGLLAFDGTHWQPFNLPENQTVRSVCIGPDGEVFCGGFAEFGYKKQGADGQMTYTSLSQNLRSQRMGKEEIWHIFQAQGCVFFQSFSVIYKFDFKKVTEIIPPAAVMFATVIEGRIWIPVIGKGLYELMPDDTFSFLPGTELLKDRIVQFLLSNGKGGLWAGTTNNGIFEIQDERCQVWRNPLNDNFKKLQLNKAIRLRDGGCVIGTILGGLYVLDKNDGLQFCLNRSNGLQNNTVLALLEDRDGNLWVGLDRGIDFVEIHSPLTFFVDQTGKIGTLYTAAQWQGQLYVGTNQGVFLKPILQPAKALNNQFQLIEGAQGQVWQLQVFDNQLLCGHNSGTFRIEDGIARKVSDVTGGWCTIRPPGNQNVLIQSTYTGLVCFKKNGDGHWVFSHKLENFSEPLREIAFDVQGNLWGTHPNWGLFHIRLSSDFRKVEATRIMTTADGLPSDFHLDLAPMNGEVYINTEQAPILAKSGTDKKLWFDKEKKGGNHQYKWLPGLANEYFVLDSMGLHLEAPALKLRISLPVQLVPRYENVVPLPDSTYLFCLENGYALFDRRLLVAGKFSKPENVGPFINLIETLEGKTFAFQNDLKIPYDQNSLKIVFSTPSFGRSPKFSWHLSGFSKHWSDWQSDGEKEFNNLREGHYLFQVCDDVSGKKTAFSFYILPPWYRTWWAYLAYAFLIFLFLWQFERYNGRLLKRQRQRLEAEKERAVMVQEIANKSRELSNAAFNLIRKNEALQSLKDNLLDSKNEPRLLSKIVREIDSHLEGDHDWEIFEESFNLVHNDFFKQLMQQFPDITPGDMRLAAYLKMNLSSKEIAPLLNISIRGIENKRYRLRKKLGLSEEANLTEFIMAF